MSSLETAFGSQNEVNLMFLNVLILYLHLVYGDLDLKSGSVRVHPELLSDVITELNDADPRDVILHVQYVDDVFEEPSRHLVVRFVNRTGRVNDEYHVSGGAAPYRRN